MRKVTEVRQSRLTCQSESQSSTSSLLSFVFLTNFCTKLKKKNYLQPGRKWPTVSLDTKWLRRSALINLKLRLLSPCRRWWLVITLTLTSLLSLSLLLHFLKQPACPGLAAVHLAKRQDYSYIPLGDISEAASRAEAHMNESRTLGEEMEDSDPEEEIRL